MLGYSSHDMQEESTYFLARSSMDGSFWRLSSAWWVGMCPHLSPGTTT